MSMRRQHNPNNIETKPFDGEWVRTQQLGWVPKAIVVTCADCGVALTLAEVPEDIPDGTPNLCGDCWCIRKTGEICDYSTGG